jgi:hypothetical protein
MSKLSPHGYAVATADEKQTIDDWFRSVGIERRCVSLVEDRVGGGYTVTVFRTNAEGKFYVEGDEVAADELVIDGPAFPWPIRVL